MVESHRLLVRARPSSVYLYALHERRFPGVKAIPPDFVKAMPTLREVLFCGTSRKTHKELSSNAQIASLATTRFLT